MHRPAAISLEPQTDASVYPAAGLIEVARLKRSKIILINTQSSEASELADLELIEPSGRIPPEILDGLQIASEDSIP